MRVGSNRSDVRRNGASQTGEGGANLPGTRSTGIGRVQWIYYRTLKKQYSTRVFIGMPADIQAVINQVLYNPTYHVEGERFDERGFLQGRRRMVIGTSMTANSRF